MVSVDNRKQLLLVSISVIQNNYSTKYMNIKLPTESAHLQGFWWYYSIGRVCQYLKITG